MKVAVFAINNIKHIFILTIYSFTYSTNKRVRDEFFPLILKVLEVPSLFELLKNLIYFLPIVGKVGTRT